ncbi:MAG: tRNA (adenosine(37)-N6)-threonylcarbamoyltransferase complex transferase subunit TsaD [Nitrospinae bacterium]|nr:tRNA (adenosine(37)-N6)-threonylcarbamoyltransferase complex transferase subunit TsaD [Nitrospinota bacterium]MBL7019919.1 tRNA (adenosine(37)-N6)-threonylcarbamoyltransferase complex transferase subunit TsaD [Nitrospinaceae bacterium]
MLVLGLETSCDETAAAVLKDGDTLLSNIINGQVEIHSEYGGIVPELAGRSHNERVHRVINEAVQKAGVRLRDIDLIAVTMGPGLIGSLLVGLNTAKGLSYGLKKPMIGVNHLEGHILAIFLQKKVEFPFIALVVSGGHTDLYRVSDFGQYKLLGRTRDDAAGESFDKVGKMLGLPFPGGPAIEKMARKGNGKAHKFPRAYLEKGSLDFSFSGLKTSVRTFLKQREQDSRITLTDEDISAGFQDAVLDVLLSKLVSACKSENLSRIVVTGGVAANGALREAVKKEAQCWGFEAFFPDPIFCTDNAAMIACAGHYKFVRDKSSSADFKELDAKASLSVE